MRFYPLLDFQYVVVTILLALGAIGVILLFFRTYARADRQDREGHEPERYAEGLSAAHNPVPLIIILLIAALVLWVSHYVFHIGIRGPAF